jgi:pimeloyl-ACP methyl ester carboxylesterase
MAGTFPLTADPFFDFETLRLLSFARYGGSDVGEVLKAASTLKTGDIELYHDTYKSLALRIKKQADAIDVKKNSISARDAYFRASTYFRSAEFFLHGNPQDPRIRALWDQHMTCFDKAISLLPQPGQRLWLKGAEFEIPAIFYPAAGDPSTPKPTFIVGGGFDGSQEELLHVFGFAALERGYNFITYEGPGHSTVRQRQGLGFIHDWEKVVTPVVDHLVTRPEVDANRLSLLGWSLGGYLSVRASAFEPRIAATIAVDGVMDGSAAFLGMLPAEAQSAYESGDSAKLNDFMEKLLASGTMPTGLRWALENGTYSFAVNKFSDFLAEIQKMTLEGITDRVKRPVLICEASNDMFFKGQPEAVKKALGDLGTWVILTDEDAASAHCHLGALVYSNQIIFDWLSEVYSH